MREKINKEEQEVLQENEQQIAELCKKLAIRLVKFMGDPRYGNYKDIWRASGKITEEYHEFLAEVHNKNPERAKEEALDLMVISGRYIIEGSKETYAKI